MTHSELGAQNEILNKNLKYLEEKHSVFYAKVINFIENSENESNTIEIVNSKNNLLNFSISRNGKKFFLHSNYDPYKEGYIVSDLEDDLFDTIVILGFGLGYHVEQIIGRFPDRNKLIIETDIEIFVTCLKCRDITGILGAKNVTLVLTSDYKEIYNELVILHKHSVIFSLKFVQLGSYNHIYSKMWSELQTEFLKYLNDYVVNVRTQMAFNKLWLYNFFSNILHLDQTANFNSFEGKFETVPAILVSAGPSLEKSIPYLKSLENKALIIAAGSTINSLLKNGIIPHMILGIDGGEAMSESFNLVDRDDILLAFMLNLHYDCVNKYKGPKLYIKTTSEPHVYYFEKKVGLSTTEVIAGASVANVTLDFLVKLGCDPIILVGQDLAYTGMKSHAEGSICSLNITNAVHSIENDKVFVKVKDMFGEITYTNQVFLTMKYWFDNYFKMMSGKRTFINASAGGMKLENVISMNLEEVLGKYCTERIEIRSKISEIHKESLCKNLIDNYKIKEFFTELRDVAQKSKESSDKRIKMCRRVLKNLKNGIVKNATNKIKDINKITKKLEEDDFYRDFILARCSNAVNMFKNNAEQEILKVSSINEKLIILYEGLLKQFCEAEDKIQSLIINIDALVNKEEDKM